MLIKCIFNIIIIYIYIYYKKKRKKINIVRKHIVQ